MARPAYIIEGYGHATLAGVTDFQTVLTDLQTRLANIGWNVISSGAGSLVIESPVVDSVRYFRLTFSMPSSTRLQCVLRDRILRVTSTREMQISGTVSIGLYYSARYLYINNETTSISAGETIYASLLSLAPESETVHNKDTVFFGSRSSASSIGGNSILTHENLDSGGTYLSQASAGTPSRTIIYSNRDTTAVGESATSYHASGARRWYAMWSHCGTPLRGRLYNVLISTFHRIFIGAEYTVPIDEATVGIFKVLNVPDGGSGFYMAVRIG